jgi:hypothetical protein
VRVRDSTDERGKMMGSEERRRKRRLTGIDFPFGTLTVMVILKFCALKIIKGERKETERKREEIEKERKAKRK